MNSLLTKRKFESLSNTSKHKYAASLVKAAYLDSSKLPDYQSIEALLSLEKCLPTKEALSNRYHYHLNLAKTETKEDGFLPNITHFDTLKETPFLDVDIFLDNLRSLHNVGSIIRTAEALRIGHVHLSEKTSGMDRTKILKTAMGALDFVECFEYADLEKLKRPIIALETSTDAISLYDFKFPDTFTLALGNEEIGLSEASMKLADFVVKIPLFGVKNSLNVASAFAIVANEIQKQKNSKTL
jgi:tRNA G18 (ribose-2'-O)-methylase SpoU